jgi:hypothetical protein
MTFHRHFLYGIAQRISYLLYPTKQHVVEETLVWIPADGMIQTRRRICYSSILQSIFIQLIEAFISLQDAQQRLKDRITVLELQSPQF